MICVAEGDAVSAVEVDVTSDGVQNAVKGEGVAGIKVDASTGANAVEAGLDLTGKVD